MENPRKRLVAQLREKLQKLEGGSRGTHDLETNPLISLGHPALDRLFPEGGVRRGTLMEWLSTEPGSGAEGMALDMAWRACPEEKVVVVLETDV